MLSLLVAASAFPAAPPTAPTPLNTTGWSTVMMISAHPDDNESGAGGLTAMLTAAGVKVVFMVVTNGNKGCHPGNAVVDCGPITPPEIAALRKKEAKAAADALGVSELIMLDGFADGMLYTYPPVQVRQEITAHVRRVKPDVVMTWKMYGLRFAASRRAIL